MLYNVKYTPGAAGTFSPGQTDGRLGPGNGPHIPSSFVSHAGDCPSSGSSIKYHMLDLFKNPF